MTIDTAHPLDAIITQFAPGRTVTVEVYRDGGTIKLQVTLGTRPGEPLAEAPDRPVADLGQPGAGPRRTLDARPAERAVDRRLELADPDDDVGRRERGEDLRGDRLGERLDEPEAPSPRRRSRHVSKTAP